MLGQATSTIPRRSSGGTSGCCTAADGDDIVPDHEIVTVDDHHERLMEKIRDLVCKEMYELKVAVAQDVRQALVDRDAEKEVKERKDKPTVGMETPAPGQSSSQSSSSSLPALREEKDTEKIKDIGSERQLVPANTAIVVGQSSVADGEDPESTRDTRPSMAVKKKKQGKGDSGPPVFSITDLNQLAAWMRYQFTAPPSFSKKKRVLTGLGLIVEGWRFQAVFGFVVIVNAVYLGWYANFTVDNELNRLDGKEHGNGLWVIPMIFEGLFFIEIMLRIGGLKRRYFKNAWNYLDMVVIFIPLTYLLVLFFDPSEVVRNNATMGFQVPGLSIMRALRVVRLVHTFQLFRLPVFAEFRMIVNAIILSMPSFVWCSLLAGFAFYVGAVAFMLGVASHLQSLSATNASDQLVAAQLRKTWQSLPLALMQLFMSVTGGIDWRETWTAVKPLHAMYKVGIVMFITFMVFAMLNIISGMFTERAFRVVSSDKDFWIVEEARQHRMYADRLLGLFQELDIDASDSLTWQEFDEYLTNPHIAAYFSWLGVDVSNAAELFKIIDLDEDGIITVREFMEGCIDVKGGASNVAVQTVQIRLEELIQRIDPEALKGESYLMAGQPSRGASKQSLPGKEAKAWAPAASAARTKRLRSVLGELQ